MLFEGTFKFTRFLEEHMLACPSKKYLHLDCPGCGFQRSLVALLRGDVSGSLHLYPATIPILLLLIFALLHIRFKYPKGSLILKVLYISCASVILVSFLYKIITKT